MRVADRHAVQIAGLGWRIWRLAIRINRGSETKRPQKRVGCLRNLRASRPMRLSTAMRTYIFATCRSKSRAMRLWLMSLIQCILVSKRLLRWYPLNLRQTERPRYREALTASFWAMAPADRGLPRLGVLARRKHSMGIADGNRILAFAGVAVPIFNN